MFRKFQPYPYYRRYYDLNPYHYRRYYNPYSYYNSQIASVDQNMINFGNMTDVIQDSSIYQLRTPEPENVGICTEPPTE